MAGSARSISLKGRAFPIKSDAEIKVIPGGRNNSESATYGDGTSKPIVDVVKGNIQDVVVNVEGVLADTLIEISRTRGSYPITYRSEEKVWEGTGYAVFPDGFSINSRTGESDPFEVHSSTPDGFRSTGLA